MIDAVAWSKSAEHRRAMENLSAVDRELRAAARARLVALADPPPKEVRDEFAAGAPMRVSTRRDKNGREFREYRIEDPKTGRALAVILEPKDGGGGRVMIVADGKDAATFSVQYREEEGHLVPWDLVAEIQAELSGGAPARLGP